MAQTANTALTLLYWHIGRRILQDVLNNQRAGYGEKIAQALSAQLTLEFGRGYSQRNLEQMIRFAEVFPDLQIAQALTAQLSWTHFVHVIRLDDPLKRDFYAEMCRIEKWSTRTLESKIDGMLYERTALSKKPDKLIRKELDALRREDRVTPDLVFRDPYFLDFLGLRDSYAKKDVESAILREMESFILEMGTGFAFLERQKRIKVDGTDHYLDLLFYHRNLGRLVAIELKLGEFKPADKARWNSTSPGSTATSARKTRKPPSASSSAPAGMTKPSNSSTSEKAASKSPPTGPKSYPKPPSNASSTKPSAAPSPGSRKPPPRRHWPKKSAARRK